ncbi:MAG: glucokinase [Deltaproteobacteria bacterium]|nr:glucokinase [Deltaproteobacteria bacterium]
MVKTTGKLILAGDVGGTKTLLGLFRSRGDALECLAKARYENNGFSGLFPIISRFLKDNKPSSPVDSACLAIACPIENNAGTLTNLGWRINGNLLQKRFGIKKVELINDLAGIGHGIACLARDDFSVLQAGRPRSGNAAIIAAGTGLGEAIIFRHRDERCVSASEGGHTDFAPRTELEMELFAHLSRSFGHVSYERVASGQGLVNIFGFLIGRRGTRTKDQEFILSSPKAPLLISEAALNGRDKDCELAVRTFVSILGAEAGNLALKSMAVEGVYLAGGIPPKLIRGDLKKAFIASFRDKGRFKTLLSRIPVRLVLNDEAGLLGAASVATRMLG